MCSGRDSESIVGGNDTVCNETVIPVPSSRRASRSRKREEMVRLGCLRVDLYSERDWAILTICVPSWRQISDDVNGAFVSNGIESEEVVFSNVA